MKGWCGSNSLRLGPLNKGAVNLSSYYDGMVSMPKEKCSFTGCQTKLTLVSIRCKCEKKYCNAHRPPENHMCSYDYKSAGKEELLKLMSTAIVAKKIEVV